MSAIRYSGDLRIRLTYIDTTDNGALNGVYRCAISYIGKDSAQPPTVCTVRVFAPFNLTKSVDCPAAFDEAAKNALARASADEWPIDVYARQDSSGYVVSSATRGPDARRPKKMT